MESLSETTWDVVISGTGLPQSLLALALSRSGKKVLHVDKNDHYGGAEAALSLQEVDEWADNANHRIGRSPFRNISLNRKEQDIHQSSDNAPSPQLGFSRAYSLSLSPQVIYSRSNVLPALVSSKVYRQLEFLAVGSWWLYKDEEEHDASNVKPEQSGKQSSKGHLQKIPGGREDVFADRAIDRRSMMSLMKFLKVAADLEAHSPLLDEWGQKPFFEFLERHYKIPPRMQEALLALTLSPNSPKETSTDYALPRIHRHLTSIGMFGPGFGSVIPKWGGLAEIAQVACRAGAVGGGVYVLKKELLAYARQEPEEEGTCADSEAQLSMLSLGGDDEVKAHWLVGSQWDLPFDGKDRPRVESSLRHVAHSVTIVSGTLSELFPPPAEDAPPPAGAVVVFPIQTLRYSLANQDASVLQADLPPVYLMIHTSETGECPTGQCIIYGHIFHQNAPEARIFLQMAVERILLTVNEEPPPSVLWSMYYDQAYVTPEPGDYSTNVSPDTHINASVIQLPDLPPGPALEDDVLEQVRGAYQRIMGDEGAGFMMFEDREDLGIDEDSNR